jgi:hypothetical protein
MKQGLAKHLQVKFKGLTVSNVSTIEFVFSQTKDGKPLKVSMYATGQQAHDVEVSNNVFYVPFEREETYLFKPDTVFYMDTRITLNGNLLQDAPDTPIVPLRMNPTLFGPIDNAEVSV